MLAVPIPIFERGNEQLLGHAVNISLRGILIVGEYALPLEQRLEIDMEIPGDSGRWERTPFIAYGVRSFNDPEEPDIFNTGMRIDYVTPQALFSLQRLIHELESYT